MTLYGQKYAQYQSWEVRALSCFLCYVCMAPDDSSRSRVETEAQLRLTVAVSAEHKGSVLRVHRKAVWLLHYP